MVIPNELEINGKLSSKKFWLTIIFCGAIIFFITLGIYIYLNIKNSNDETITESANYYKSPPISMDDADAIKMIEEASRKVRASQESINISNNVMVPPIIGTNKKDKPQNIIVPPIDAVDQTKQQEIEQQRQEYYSALKSANGKIKLSAINLDKSSISVPISQHINSKSNASDAIDSKFAQNVSIRKKAMSPYTLKAGTNIPLTLTKGLNSDKPGSVTGLVRADVFDSATHKILLIPQGSTMFGKYDNQIAFGDKRIAVAFSKLYYPDGTYIDLQAVPGTDIQGFSGFSDKVDNHYWSLFGTSFIIGIITGAMQYSQNNTNPNVQVGGIGVSTNPSIGQTMSGSLGQQLGQTGLAIVNKGINVQPTIIIRDGSKVNAEIAAELVLAPLEH